MQPQIDEGGINSHFALNSFMIAILKIIVLTSLMFSLHVLFIFQFYHGLLFPSFCIDIVHIFQATKRLSDKLIHQVVRGNGEEPS